MGDGIISCSSDHFLLLSAGRLSLTTTLVRVCQFFLLRLSAHDPCIVLVQVAAQAVGTRQLVPLRKAKRQSKAGTFLIRSAAIWQATVERGDITHGQQTIEIRTPETCMHLSGLDK